MQEASQRTSKPLWRSILPQILILTLVGFLYLLSLLGVIPSPAQLNGILVEKFKLYGIPLIAFCAFLENLVGVNVYFPGAFTILTGMALTSGNPSQAVVTYFAIYLPSYTANISSFYLGFLSRKENPVVTAPKKQNTLLWFFFTYWHPQLAAITAFSAGSSGLLTPQVFWRHSFAVSLFWSVFWGVVIYQFGFAANFAENFVTLFLAYVVIWMAIDVFKWFKRKSQTASF